MGHLGMGSMGAWRRLGPREPVLLFKLQVGAHSHLAQRASGHSPCAEVLVIIHEVQANDL
jgi:hypothetical protein